MSFLLTLQDIAIGGLVLGVVSLFVIAALLDAHSKDKQE